MDKKTKAQVRIFGNRYTLVGAESEEYITEVCSAVDKKMREIARNPGLKPMALSVLAAVNFCDEYFKTKELLDEANAELRKYKEEIIQIKNELLASEHEKNFLKDEIKTMRKRGL